jgi:hypothetical protein
VRLPTEQGAVCIPSLRSKDSWIARLFAWSLFVYSGEDMLKAVVFDFDGIIVDSEPLHYRAFQKVLEPLGAGFSWAQYTEK